MSLRFKANLRALKVHSLYELEKEGLKSNATFAVLVDSIEYRFHTLYFVYFIFGCLGFRLCRLLLAQTYGPQVCQRA